MAHLSIIFHQDNAQGEPAVALVLHTMVTPLRACQCAQGRM
ncbi:MAG TPA: hypothetical protein VFS85_10355 [Dongiaceae bacterium]|nr:hypothetical protein [Dongiaceae bacterium]